MSSILNDTKKVLNVPPDYDAFDLDIITHINAAFSVVNQLGIGPDTGYYIEDDEFTWEDLNLPTRWTNLLKTYLYLKVRALFDPPSTSFMITSMEEQLKEYEWRLSHYRETENETDL